MGWSFERIYAPEERGAGGGGVAWDGEAVLFSLGGAGRIMRFEPSGGRLGEFRRYAGLVHGLAVGPAGRVYGCQSASRRLVRFDEDGSTSVLPYRLGGRLHNFPHDLAVDGSGRIWFSDPRSDLAPPGPNIFPPLEHASILRLEPTAGRGWRMRRMTFDTLNPCAVCLSADERTLFVSERAASPAGFDELRAYPIEDGGLGAPVAIYRFGGDRRGPHRGVRGMCVDALGRIVACAGGRDGGPGPMIYVLDVAGRPLAAEPAPSEPVACAFGGPDRRTLYVTTSPGELYAVEGVDRT